MKTQKGESLLIRSDKSFEDRVTYINDNLSLNSDIVLLKNKSISIEDVRDFQNDFQKTSSELNPDFKKLGVLIFDNIGPNASNSLLKILEDIDKENCIILYTNKNIKLLSTVLSRVIESTEDEIKKNKNIKEPDLTDKDNIDKQEVIEWIKYKIEISKINKDKQPLIWINSPSPNIKSIVEYTNLFY